MNPMGITQNAARRLAEAIRSTERLDRHGINNGAPWDWSVQPSEKGWPIKITGKTSGGNYTGKIQYYDAMGWHDWPTNPQCVVVPNNGGALTTGDIYNGLFVNIISGSPYYAVDSGDYATGGSGSGASGAFGSRSGGSGVGPTLTCVADVGCTPGGSGTRVTYQVVSLTTGAILSMWYVDKGCCNCGTTTPIPSGFYSSGAIPTVMTFCCPNAIPATIYATVLGVGSYPLTYDSVFGGWKNNALVLPGCGSTFLDVTCLSDGAGGYTWTMNSGGVAGLGVESASCSPFQLVFSGPLYSSGSCTGTYTITVTE